ncbi:hypothetical protein LU631_03770 [Erwinia tracheiphila]|uniref:DUF4175 domain-containing protein n=1 Tax=Erwinia tracheiphila TaxID=65700 RepID=A0A0M2KIK0_9GAMM|nr:hypothetical protein [Erwinia tracheiphila]EOS95385.1 hypothetical protein ETR_08576 [Erwinia tracheiphila PSU-1]KKF37142.1 hypothetical protein SY86_19795 [Erwinia tracheiphila]UIA88527.1 hypothetical protein LU631_03770 [Erwinia tracheiphila]UIA96905.1 hypothetical protein LU633_02445 [Erwinia tracheiphila]
MTDFFKKWLRTQVKYFASTLIPVMLILGFGMLAVTFWPPFAWGSTAIFALAVIAVTVWLV